MASGQYGPRMTATVTVPVGVARAPRTLAAPTAVLAVAAPVALVLALWLPVGTAVLGLAAFGILHNALELRYVVGRFEGILAGPFLWLCLALITGVAACRLAGPGAGPRAAEIVLCYALLFAACWRAWRDRPARLAAAGVAVVAAALVSLSFPGYHFVVLAHLHNVVPLVFLWAWSADAGRGRAAFRAVNLAWVLALPALLLAGAFDAALRAAPVGGFTVQRLAAAYTPPAWLDGRLALRFLAVFAFLQTMHYVVWLAVFPRYAPDAAARFDARVPALRGGRVWLVGLAVGAVFAGIFAWDYASGRTLYASLASYHAYLEFPVLLALIFAYRPKGVAA